VPANSTPPFDLAAVRRIWVRAPNWLGDLVMATPAFARLRAAFPRAHITGGMRPFLQPLVADTGFFDAIVPTPKLRGLGALRAEVAAMRAQRFDLAVVLPNSFVTGVVPFLARVPRRLGYTQGRPGLMTHGLRAAVRRHWWQRREGPRRWPVPMPTYYRELLDVLGIADLPADPSRPRLTVTPAADAWVDEHLRARGVAPGTPLLQLVVGANFGASKLWLPERFAEVARHFQRHHGMRALVLVGPSEVELGARIASAGDALLLDQPVLPLDRLQALVRRAALVVTGDTGPRHLAVAFDRPVVCLIGPTDPNYTAYCLERTVLIRKDLPCVPCQKKVCPLGHHRCMRDIAVDEVVAAGESLLGLRG
jgi:heptosyltransferase-2